MNNYDDPRPIRVTLLAILILIIALFEGVRLGESIYFWKTLIEYGAQPLYLSVSGGIWLIGGCLLVWGLWQGRRWSWLGSIVGTIAFTLWYWLDRLFLQQPHNNGPFAVVASSIFLVLILVILLTRRTRGYLLKRGS